MRYTPQLRDKFLQQTIDSAAERLHTKLLEFNFASISISDYNRNYLFQNYLSNPQGTVQKYATLLAYTLQAIDRPLSEITFCEYGGGIGMLSLLAREVGLPVVIYNDIDTTTCKDAQAIAQGLACEAQHYVTGDIEELLEYTKQHMLVCNVVASYDVIEHIYNIETFLQKITLLSSAPHFTLSLSSGANGCNPRIKRALLALHHEHEYEDRTSTWGHTQRNCLESFLKVREQIIRDYLAQHQQRSRPPSLTHEQIIKLAEVTRGQMRKDIHRSVDRFILTHAYPAVPSTTDTCDPYTGSWSEHIMDPWKLATLLERNGLKAKVGAGTYQSQDVWWKKFVCRVMNSLLRLLPARIGLWFSPYYTILAVRPTHKLQ